MKKFQKCSVGLAVFSFILSSGCGFNPYVQSNTPRPGYVPSKDKIESLKKEDFQYKSGTSSLKTVHVSVADARAYAHFLQDAYEDALGRRSMTRTAINFGTLTTALAAIGIGMSGGSEDAALYTGLASAALGISGQLLLTRDHETAYSLGGQAVGCVLSAATNHRPNNLKLLAIKAAKNDLANTLKQYEIIIEQYKSLGDERYNKGGNNVKISTNEIYQLELVLAKKRINMAIPNLEYVNVFLQSTDILGEQLLNKIEEIRWKVNDSVRRSEPDILVLNDGLRSILTSRIPGLSVKIPDAAGQNISELPGDEVKNSAKTNIPKADMLIGKANEYSEKIELAIASLKKALDNAGGEPLKFEESVFSGCAFAGGQLPSEPAALTLNPASVNISARQDAEVVTVITGGVTPFVAQASGLAKSVKVTGRILTVLVSASEATAGKKIHTIVSDFFGRSADFTINVDAPPKGGSQEIKNIQTSLNKTAGAGLMVDGFLGEDTRKALISELVKEHLEPIVKKLNEDSAVPACKSAVKAIRSKFNPGTVDESSVKVNLTKLYSDAEKKSKSSVKQDELLINFISECKILG